MLSTPSTCRAHEFRKALNKCPVACGPLLPPVRSKPDWEKLADGARLGHFFTARWHHLQQRHLGNYQWLLMLDGDIGVVNMSRSLDKFLEFPEDIIFHLRCASE